VLHSYNVKSIVKDKANLKVSGPDKEAKKYASAFLFLLEKFDVTLVNKDTYIAFLDLKKAYDTVP